VHSRSKDGCMGLDKLPYSVREEYVDAKGQGCVRSRLETKVASGKARRPHAIFSCATL
jgi:hypothetical protein